jgi:hypothetical protein
MTTFRAYRLLAILDIFLKRSRASRQFASDVGKRHMSAPVCQEMMQIAIVFMPACVT